MSMFVQRRVEVAHPEATMVHVHGASKQSQRFDAGEANIFLVGLRGSGKTTLGRVLAARLGMPFVDTDEEIVRRAGKDISNIVADSGWEAFRSMEANVLQEVCTGAGQVVATGGGIVLDPQNRLLLDRSGVVFYLMADLSVLMQRLAKDPLAGQRPALTSLSPDRELVRCLQERGPLYMTVANHVLFAERTPGELVEAVLEKLGLAGDGGS